MTDLLTTRFPPPLHGVALRPLRPPLPRRAGDCRAGEEDEAAAGPGQRLVPQGARHAVAAARRRAGEGPADREAVTND